MFKNLFKKLAKLLLGFIAFIGLWLLCAWLLPFIKVNNSPIKVQKPITLIVKSNGVHTDIVLPRSSSIYDWDKFIAPHQFENIDSTFKQISFGWGDKGFYLDTPTWDDLKASTAINATFGLGSTAMHVTYYHNLNINENTKELHISENDYKNLIAYIKQSFSYKNDSIQLITHPNYGDNDNYYEATGKYNLFKTCNVWAGDGLKEANVCVGIWTPLASSIINHL